MNETEPAPESKIIRIDEDWKVRARQEKELLQQQKRPAPASPPTPKKADAPAGAAEKKGPKRPEPRRGERTPFMEFVNALATETLVYLGAIAHPQTGQAYFAPEQAQHTLDLLHLLEEKTQGNLTPDEEQLLKGAVHELRLAYVEMTQNPPGAAPARPGPAPRK